MANIYQRTNHTWPLLNWVPSRKIYLCGFEDIEKWVLSCETADPNKLFSTV
jgi:hypothetical protein